MARLITLNDEGDAFSNAFADAAVPSPDNVEQTGMYLNLPKQRWELWYAEEATPRMIGFSLTKLGKEAARQVMVLLILVATTGVTGVEDLCLLNADDENTTIH